MKLFLLQSPTRINVVRTFLYVLLNLDLERECFLVFYLKSNNLTSNRRSNSEENWRKKSRPGRRKKRREREYV